jgi:predicted dehydrogenase
MGKENAVALCDVNEKCFGKAAKQHPSAKKYVDFRKLFDDAKSFDAVVVSTCEHTHAFATLPALQLGKHVYCEKPLTHGIWESRVVSETAAKNPKLVTQMGIQLHASENYRKVVDLIQAGVVGPVRECHIWVSRAWGWQSPADAKKNKDIVSVQDRPKETMPVPAGLHWDLWLGPAPARPFHSVYFPGPKWYRWWDFGSGTMSDLGSHRNDLAFWALKLEAPLTVEGFGPPVHPEIAPASFRAVYEYGPRGEMPAVKLVWYQGAEKPPQWHNNEIPRWGNGCLFVGEKGMLLADYGKFVLLPEDKFKGYKAPPRKLPKSPGHQAEWLQAIKTGSAALAPFSYSGPLTEANHLASIAYRLGKKLEWDAAAMKVKNAPEADPLVKRAYREGWKLA